MMMKYKLIFAAAIVATTAVSGVPAQAKFVYRNLEVEKCTMSELPESDTDDIIIKCFAIMAPLNDCVKSGGEVGTIGTRMVCRGKARAEMQGKVRPVGPPPFFPDDASASQFKPLKGVPATRGHGKQGPWKD
jgi:hypothetical protein